MSRGRHVIFVVVLLRAFAVVARRTSMATTLDVGMLDDPPSTADMGVIFNKEIVVELDARAFTDPDGDDLSLSTNHAVVSPKKRHLFANIKDKATAMIRNGLNEVKKELQGAVDLPSRVDALNQQVVAILEGVTATSISASVSAEFLHDPLGAFLAYTEDES